MPTFNPLRSQDRRIAVSTLETGYVCTADISDPANRLLLAAGTELTREFIQRLKARGITHVQVGVRDYAKLASTRSSGKPTPHVPLAKHASRVDRTSEPHSSVRAARFKSQLNNALNLLDCVAADVLDITSTPMAELIRVPEAIAEMLVEDADQAIVAAQCDERSKLLSARCAQMSVLASAVAMELQLSDSDVELVGTAGLLHDIGLFLLPLEVRDPSRAMNSTELEAYRSHPKLSVKLLSDCYSISEPVKLLIVQAHELPDGSGFPRGLKKHMVHPLTRILNAVDIFLSLTAPGPGRPAIVAHDAIHIMLHQCRKGIIDPEAMRALINQITLYPLGSSVRLDDNSIAFTARRDGNHYDMPIISLDGTNDSQLIPTRQCAHKILSPHFDPAIEMRVGRDTLDQLTLDHLILC